MSVCLDIGCGTLCRSGSCMLRCWLWDAVPIWFLYASVLVVERCADSEVGGREGGPLAGLFPGWSIFVELYICFGNILWSR